MSKLPSNADGSLWKKHLGFDAEDITIRIDNTVETTKVQESLGSFAKYADLPPSKPIDNNDPKNKGGFKKS